MVGWQLSDPNVVLTPAHPIFRVFARFLGDSAFPDLPELQILITRTGSNRRPIGTECTAQDTAIVGWYIVYLFQ